MGNFKKNILKISDNMSGEKTEHFNFEADI